MEKVQQHGRIGGPSTHPAVRTNIWTKVTLWELVDSSKRLWNPDEPQTEEGHLKKVGPHTSGRLSNSGLSYRPETGPGLWKLSSSLSCPQYCYQSLLPRDPGGTTPMGTPVRGLLVLDPTAIPGVALEPGSTLTQHDPEAVLPSQQPVHWSNKSTLRNIYIL